MKKSTLINFINRYFLAEATDSIKIESKNGRLHTKFITSDNQLVGELNADIDLKTDTNIGIYATSALLKMLSACGSDIDVDLTVVSDKAVSMNISDNVLDMSFILADMSVVRDVPALTQVPDWHCSIDITNDFIDKYIKSKGALPNAENFGIRCKNGKAELVINYSEINDNRIQFQIDNAEVHSDMSIVCFQANLFKEILLANKGTKGTFEVSSAGLGRVSFTGDDYDAVYYLVQLKV